MVTGIHDIHAQDDGFVKLDQRDYKIKVKQLKSKRKAL